VVIIRKNDEDSNQNILQDESIVALFIFKLID